MSEMNTCSNCGVDVDKDLTVYCDECEQCGQCEALSDRVAELEDLLRRAVKYAREDRARTDGSTRLERLLHRAELTLLPK